MTAELQQALSTGPTLADQADRAWRERDHEREAQMREHILGATGTFLRARADRDTS